MATFNFGEANGTSLETIDSKWAGSSANFVTTGTGLLGADGGGSYYATYRARYENGQPTAQKSEAVLKAQAVAGEHKGVTINDNGTVWYSATPYNASSVILKKSGSYVDVGSTAVDWTTTDGTLSIENNGSGQILVKCNGTTVITYNDGSPLTGGYPGLVINGNGTATDQQFDSWTDGVAGAPTAPTGVTAGSVTTTGFTAVWTDASNNETGFDVEYAPDPFSSWTAASGSPVAAGVTSLAITGLSSNTDYRVRVRAKGAGGDSAYVESATVKTVASVKVRPVSTVTAGPWTAVGAATQHEAIDETSPNDSDYITTSSAGTSEHALATVTDPLVSYGHTVRYRFRSATGDTYQVRLVQGTTIISTDPTPRSPGGTFTTYEWTLTPTEADAITDYSALRIRHTVV